MSLRSSDKRVRRAAAFGLAAALALVLRLPALAEPYGRDMGVFACVAGWSLDGGAPYRDMWDNKPPLVYAAYALAQLLFGPTPAGPYVLAALWTLAAMAALAKVGTAWRGERAGFAAAVLFAAFSAAPRLWGAGNGPLGETFLLPFVCFAFAIARGKAADRPAAAFAAGALCGAAFWFKATAALPAAVLAVCFASGRGPARARARRAGVFAAGFAAPAALVFAAAAAAGVLGPFWEQVFVQNFRRAGLDQSFLQTLPRGVRAARVELRYLSAFAFLALVGAVGAARARPRPWWLFGWTAAGFVSYGLGGRFYPHYLVESLPPLALLAGAGLCELARGPIRSWRAPAAAAALALFAGDVRAVGRSHYVLDWRALTGALPREKYLAALPTGLGERVSRWLRPRLRAQDTLFAWGHMAEVYVFARRWPAAPFLYAGAVLDAPAARRPEFERRLMACLARRPPTWLIVAERRMPDALRRFAASRYRAVARVGDAEILRLRADSSGAEEHG